MRVAVILALVLVGFVVPVAAFAQPSPDACSAADYAALLSDTVAALAKPDAEAATLITDLVSQLRAQQAACAGLAFSGESNEIVGPVEIPAGTYVAEAAFSYAGTATFEALTEDCEAFFQYEILASSDVDGETDSFILRTDQGCRVLIDVGTSAPWTLTFTPVQ